ncbi:MAG: zinc-dependent alcohol dehydrogenase [Actinomycetota bacterium]
MRARALWFVEPRRVEIRPVEADIHDDDDLVVRTIASGISAGTELLAYRGDIDSSTPLDETLGALGGTFAFPFRYGYACVGTVESSNASTRPGSTVFAFHPHQDVFAVRPDDAIVLDGVEPRIGTMLPLVETALQICLDAEVQLGARVVVSGLGVVGTLTALLLQRSGAEVLGIDPREDRRKLATDLGLAVVEPGEAPEAVFDRTDDAGADLVVESSGAGAALASALGLLRHEGTALVASWYGSAPVALPLGGAFHRRRLTIRSTQVSTIPARLSGAWDRRRRLMAARDLLSVLPLDALATHEFAFEEAAGAFDALDRGQPGLVHAVLDYR